MTVSGGAVRTGDPHRRTPAPAARRPEHLDLARMQLRHGWVIGTLAVWRDRARARRELRELALRALDSRFEDTGMTREDAAREARRWFWQDLLPGGRT